MIAGIRGLRPSLSLHTNPKSVPPISLNELPHICSTRNKRPFTKIGQILLAQHVGNYCLPIQRGPLNGIFPAVTPDMPGRRCSDARRPSVRDYYFSEEAALRSDASNGVAVFLQQTLSAKSPTDPYMLSKKYNTGHPFPDSSSIRPPVSTSSRAWRWWGLMKTHRLKVEHECRLRPSGDTFRKWLAYS